MTTFYHLQPGSFEYAEFYEKPLPHWLVCFADTASGPIQHLLFAVVLPDGQPRKPHVSLLVAGHTVTEAEMREKLNQLNDEEWQLFPILGMPKRLL